MAVNLQTATLADFILAVADEHPHRDAIVLSNDRITYAELGEGASAWARTLSMLGIGVGDHVGILLPNGTEFMKVLFGISLAGAVAVPMNSRYRGQEIAATVADADLATIVTTCEADNHPSFSDRLLEAFPDLAVAGDPGLALAIAPKLRSIIVTNDSAPPFFLTRERIAKNAPSLTGAGPEQRWRSVKPCSPALILYTSGSTSRPKGCLLSHTAVLLQGHLMAHRYAMTTQDRIWSPVPMFHVGGISPFVAIASVGGAFLSMPKIEPGPGLALMEREKATIAYVLFQTIITDLLQYPTFSECDLRKVRLMISNVALQPMWIRDLLAQKLPGAVQIGTYGMTETVGAACTHGPGDDADDRLNRLGRPLPGIEARIVDEAGCDVAPGGIGQILLRGPTVCSGYYKDAKKTADALREEWLYTGDRGSLDARGSMMFHGRLKDVLKVGGENVGAMEVEAIVGMHPAVKGCAVVGMPDARLVEVPVVFVELSPGMSATEEEILCFCAGKLASFKLPRHAYFVTEWPMSSTKIDKPALVRRLAATSIS